jgi:hypothetical protein
MGNRLACGQFSPEMTNLGDGVAVEPFGEAPSCPQTSFPPPERIVAVANNLFIYERDYLSNRTDVCSNQGSGAWRVDSASGHLLQHVAPDFHFAALIPGRTDPVLYGVSPGGPHWEFPGELVSIDARDGHTLQSRPLGAGFWTISVAALRMAPIGDVRAIPAR